MIFAVDSPETKDVTLDRSPLFFFHKSFGKSLVESADSIDDCNGLQPPPNFAMVAEGLYRSGYPQVKNFNFLQRLNLKSILYLCPEPYPESMEEFVRDNGINVFQHGMLGNKPVMRMTESEVRSALVHVLDARNYPMLIHCNKGKHRTGCVVGCLRKEQQWAIGSIIEEYNMYAGIKLRILDHQFVQNFDLDIPKEAAYVPNWLELEL